MRLLLALLLLSGTLAAAQSIVPRTITFEGAPQYPAAELLKLSGLAAGTRLTQPDLEAAMNRLADSGLFTGVQFKTTADSLTFVLEPSARAQAQRAAYTNFVWYTPDSLNSELHTRLPLFDGTVPADGPLAEQVRLALVAILHDRQALNATVTASAVAGGRLEYTIASPRVLVGALRIASVDFDADPLLANVRNGISGSEYIDTITQRSITGNTLDALQEMGYLDATLGSLTLGQPRISADRQRVLIDLDGAAQPGPLYKVSHVDLPKPVGTLTARDFESEHAVKAGGRPSPSLVANTTAGLEHAYQAHGFLDAKATVTPTRDNAAHTIAYAYAVVPGELYRMRALVFDVNLTAQQQSILTQAWKLPKGDVYDERTAQSSLHTEAALHVCSTRVLMNLNPDPATHEVDINLTCARPHDQ